MLREVWWFISDFFQYYIPDLFSYWFNPYKEPEYNHFGQYNVVAMNTKKGQGRPWRDKDEISYHYVLQDVYDSSPPLYYDSVVRHFDVGDRVSLLYRIINDEVK